MKATLKMTGKILPFAVFLSILVSCQNDNEFNPGNTPGLKELKIEFDFDQFGKTHNAYLDYVWNIKDQTDPEARFKYGLTFTDPTFGSFNVGQTWEDIDKHTAFHKERVESILNGSYDAATEKLSPAMTAFLDDLATSMKKAADDSYSTQEMISMIEDIEREVRTNQEIDIDLGRGVSNDGASMLAICSILKYSLQYWEEFDAGAGIQGRIMANGKIKRALADAWGYVSAWVNNGDGSYSWDHQSALVNADCVSDRVREN